MKCVQYVAPALEPITLSELKTHLRLDSGSFADNIDETQSIAPGLKAFVNDWTTHAGASVEVLGYSAVVSFASGANTGAGTVDVKIQESDDNVTFNDWPSTAAQAFTQVTVDGMLTSAALAIGTTLTAVANGIFTYFIAGVPYSKPADAAGTAPGNDVIPMGKYGAVAFDIGADNVIDVIEAAGNGAGYATAALAIAGLAAPGAGHVRMGTVTATKSDGAFTFGTTALNAVNSTVAYTQATLKANYNTTYEKAYTGTKRYIKTAAKVLVANCSLGTTIIRMGATSIEDDLLNSIITAAREHVEDITRRQLLTATWHYYLQEWPKENFIKLPFGNLQSNTKATGVITSSGANVVADDRVTIDAKTYTFRVAAVSEGQVKIGADAAESLDNLKAAINHTGTPGVGLQYVCANAHPTVEATDNTDTTQTLESILGGVDGNLIALSEIAASLSVSGTTLSGGVTSAEIEYWDVDGLATVIDVTTDYIMEFNGDQCGRIVLPYGQTWPSVALFPSNPIRVKFICGWSTAALVPSKIKSAIKMICSKLYEGRGEDVLGQTVSEDKVVQRLLASARLFDEF